MLEAISWRAIRAFQHNTHTYQCTIHSRRYARGHTLSRPFPCPSAPHSSRVRPSVSSSPTAIAFQNTAILQCIRAPRPPSVQSPVALLPTPSVPSVVGRGAERLCNCERSGGVCWHTLPGSRGQIWPWPAQVIDHQEGKCFMSVWL